MPLKRVEAATATSAATFMGVRNHPGKCSFMTTPTGQSWYDNGKLVDRKLWDAYMDKAKTATSKAESENKKELPKGALNDIFTSDKDFEDFDKLLEEAKAKQAKK
jgi:hypothetical protein